jgi:hypothetical protein
LCRTGKTNSNNINNNNIRRQHKWTGNVSLSVPPVHKGKENALFLASDTSGMTDGGGRTDTSGWNACKRQNLL